MAAIQSEHINYKVKKSKTLVNLNENNKSTPGSSWREGDLQIIGALNDLVSWGQSLRQTMLSHYRGHVDAVEKKQTIVQNKKLKPLTNSKKAKKGLQRPESYENQPGDHQLAAGFILHFLLRAMPFLLWDWEKLLQGQILTSINLLQWVLAIPQGMEGKEIASCIMQMKCGINPEICFDKQWGRTITLMTQLADKEEIIQTLFQSLLLAIEK